MEIFAALPSAHFACNSLPSGTRLATISAGVGEHAKSSKYLRSLPFRDSQARRLLSPAALSFSHRNLSTACWTGIHLRASSAGNGRKNKGDGKSKGGPEKKEDRKKKDNVWSSDAASRKSRGGPEEKDDKTQKQNVWSSGASGKSSQTSKNKGSGELKGGSGGQFVSPRQSSATRELQVELPESSNGSSPAAGKKTRNQGEDLTFLQFLSPVPPIEEETLLEAEEAIPDPVWPTFCSSNSGVWRGVGAAFSPITGELEPISLTENNEFLYDARVLSTVETLRMSEDGVVFPPDQLSLQRKVFWSLENPLGEQRQGEVTVQDDISSFSIQGAIDDEDDELEYWTEDEDTGGDDGELSDWEYVLSDDPGEFDERWENGEEEDLEVMVELEEDTDSIREDGIEWTSMWGQREFLDGDWEGGGLPAGESENVLSAEQKASNRVYVAPSSVGSSYAADLTDALGSTWMDVMEEDNMDREPGLVFFEDGAYSRGPLGLLAGTSTSGREYFNSYTCRVEQCLVAGGHKRLRIVHTISVEEEGEEVEVLRVAVYEEEWMGPCNMKSISDVGGHQLKLFSERTRHAPEDLVGTWKVFEVDAMAIHPLQSTVKEKASFAYSCKETSIKRGLPAMPTLTVWKDEESVNLSDFSMLWLTGSVSTYVVVTESGILTFGVGWICDDGTRLVMERVYGEDGKLSHVNSKSEIKGGWVGGRM